MRIERCAYGGEISWWSLGEFIPRTPNAIADFHEIGEAEADASAA